MHRDPRVFLWDVREAADDITQFTAGLDADGYERNKLVRAAVERKFEIIGEALNLLSRTRRIWPQGSRPCVVSSIFAISSAMAMRR
jgi:uncharacterized protein with HEPN domain